MTADSVLQGFVNYANLFNTDDLPITLTVNGQIITGRLISEQRYHQGLKKTFGAKEDFPLELEHLTTPAEYIHLKDARFMTSDGSTFPIHKSGYLWRGKLSAVDSFVLMQVKSLTPKQVFAELWASLFGERPKQQQTA